MLISLLLIVVILFLHRVVLPRFGINIGTENLVKKNHLDSSDEKHDEKIENNKKG